MDSQLISANYAAKYNSDYNTGIVNTIHTINHITITDILLNMCVYI